MGSLALSLGLTAFTGCMSSGTKNDGRTAGQVINDNRITSQLENNLNREPVYKFNGVAVKTFDGIVQLSGFVDTEQQKSRADQIAHNVPGVARVDNGISLKPQNLAPTGRTNNASQPVNSNIETNNSNAGTASANTNNTNTVK
jgi:hypothetical protein